MDYEKAFKEAYGRASLRFGTNVANELFLEYKESKEERTRRKLIEFFSDWSKTKSYCWGIPVTDIMDWLEKQGEQKPVEWKQENREELTEFENAMMHIGGSFFGENAGLDPNDTDTIKEQAELLLELAPKQEWSEEDEEMIEGLNNCLDELEKENGWRYIYVNSKNVELNKVRNWLKSFKKE